MNPFLTSTLRLFHQHSVAHWHLLLHKHTPAFSSNLPRAAEPQCCPCAQRFPGTAGNPWRLPVCMPRRSPWLMLLLQSQRLFQHCVHTGRQLNSLGINTGTGWAAASLGHPVDVVYHQIRMGTFQSRIKFSPVLNSQHQRETSEIFPGFLVAEEVRVLLF